MQLPLFDSPDTAVAQPAAAFAALDEARAAALACTRCGLARTRQRVVFGAGAAPARLFVLGEGPSEADDASGTPFSGPSGRVLDAWLRTLGTSRARGLGVQRGTLSRGGAVRATPAQPATAAE